MKWNLKLVKAKHYLTTRNEDGVVIKRHRGYYDQDTNVIVPLFKTITPKMLIHMEEASQTEQGDIFMDISTGFCGVLVTDYERIT